MQNSSRKKFKLKDPSKFISALTILLDAAILSYFIQQNVILVFFSLVLVYIAVYAFFEKRRMAATYSEDEDYDYDEDVEDDIRYSKSVTRKSYTKSKPNNGYDDYDDEEDEYEYSPKYRKPPAKSVNKDFDVIKSAKFNAPDDEYDDDDNSWRSMYNKNTGDMGQAHPAFDEEYKKYFSTALPDREEISKAQRKNKYNDDPKSKYRNHDDESSMRSSDNLETFDSNDSDSGDYKEESGEDDSEEHLLNPGELEDETADIRNKVDDLLEDEEDKYNLRHSVTSKLKLFRKSRNNIVEEYNDEDGITSNEELIDELYKDNKHRSFFDDSEYSEELSDYDDSGHISNDSQSEIDSVTKSLETILDYLDIDASVKDVLIGNSVTRYILKLKSISSVNRIKLFEDDLQKMLNRGSLMITDVNPEKALVGIDIPSSETLPVSFDNLTLSDEFRKSNSNTSFILGADSYNNIVLADIQKMQHLLITGSPEEKDTCINVLISSILSKVRVFDIDFIMIDISGNNLNKYNGIPHMFTPVINKPEVAVTELTSLINLINTRHDLFARQDVVNISEYNNIMPQNPLSHIIVFINDLEEFMRNDPKDMEELISAIAQKSRSAGVYLIVGTSNYSDEILTGLIKANIPSKICFKLENYDESLSVMGVSGAQKLLGSGDMLYYPRGNSFPERIQGADITESTIENLVKAIL